MQLTTYPQPYLFLTLFSILGSFFISIFSYLHFRHQYCVLTQAICSDLDNIITNAYSTSLQGTNLETQSSKIRAKLEAIVSLAQHSLKESSQRLTEVQQIVSDISHQLKTPLSALVMYNDIIAGEAQDAEAVIGFSQKTSAALRRIERLVQSLLKITRLDAGAVAFEKQDWLLADVASKAVEELWVRAKAEGKRITLAGAEEVKINCDLSWTVEALSNLVKNALDYTPEGGEIEVAWERMAEMVRISVSDNGKGIAEEDYYHIFKRFYRSKGVQGDSQGIGLGLSLAKSIVEGQKGTLSVESGADAGSVFTMTFPG